MLQQEQIIGRNKGQARVCLWNKVMIKCGFAFGQRIRITSNPDGILVVPDESGKRKVSRVTNHGNILPVIDLKQTKTLDLTPLGRIGDSVVVTFEQDQITIKPTNAATVAANYTSTPSDHLPSAQAISSIESAVASLLSATEDARMPGDSSRRGRFRSGWKDATERDKDEYTASALSKITWQNLGYRLGNELGIRSDQWINAVYEHIAASWDAKFFAPTFDTQELEEQVDALRESYPLGPPPKGNKRPAKRRVADSEAIERDPQVKRWVLDIADGVCELCHKPSPYRSKAKGNPWYLEVHHVVPLKKNGPDTVCNAVALCPNCHTRCHQSVDALDATTRLYDQVERLIRPE